MHTFQLNIWVPTSHGLVWKSQAMDIRKRFASITYGVVSSTSNKVKRSNIVAIHRINTFLPKKGTGVEFLYQTAAWVHS